MNVFMLWLPLEFLKDFITYIM